MPKPAAAKIIAEGAGWHFWLIGTEVYRAAVGGVLDIYGLPASRRWECSHAHWLHYRANFDWAQDVSAS